ncbi:venom serine carboxypeptidase-like [Amyelois transitella]|uniref:venom serine carboxypeptidase-like n=1 Tax=Amyelois transitella TaxID=680683 RepID=UPI00298FA995|nr:venom serine carboxypeptidase-like [Amyelois transitella]
MLFLQIFSSYNCFLHTYPRILRLIGDGGDPGEALFLSPYVESGNVTEGRRLARVPLTDTLGIESFAGYLTVNKTYNSNQFFWYFPAMENRRDAPIVLWLQGGPGGSSLFGLFTENGPIRVRNNKLERRKYHWALNHHLIYIDNPVGTGFSFTDDPKGYCTDQVRVGEELYSSVVQFLQLFPELQSNKFFVTGESYAGKYVPALAYTIHKKNPDAKIKVNLKGLGIGNGFSDPVHQIEYGEYLSQIGLIDFNQKKVFEDYQAEIKYNIEQERWANAINTMDTLIQSFYNLSGFTTHFNILHTSTYSKDIDFGDFIQKSTIRQQIHVGNYAFNDGSVVEQNLNQDIMKSVAPWIAELLDHYNILIYNGQLDIIVAYPLTVNFLSNLNFTAADVYKTAERYIWSVDGEVAGYVKGAGRLVEVMVRNAGHMVPGDQPKWALDMITRLTHEETLAGYPTYWAS